MFRRYDCSTVSDMLPLHAGGDLDPRHQAAVDEHLHACLNCFREFRELASLRGQLRAAADESLPDGILDGFAEEVMARVRLGEPGPAAAPPTAPLLRLRLTRRLAAAALVVAAGLAVTLMLRDGEAVGGEGPLMMDAAVARQVPDGQRQAIGWPAPSIQAAGGTLPSGSYGAAPGMPASSGIGSVPSGRPDLGFMQGLVDSSTRHFPRALESFMGDRLPGSVRVEMLNMDFTGEPQDGYHVLIVPNRWVQELLELEAGQLRRGAPFVSAPPNTPSDG